MTIPIIWLVWLGLGLVAAPFSYAMTFAYFWRKYDVLQGEETRKEDQAFAVVACLFTFLVPPTVIIVYLMSAFAHYGLKWK